MFVIGNDKSGKPKGRVAWHKIRAEYINGKSQAWLSKKYGVSRNMISRHSMSEGWTEARIAAQAEIQQKVVEKTAESVADNATLALRIKTKLLARLDTILDSFPTDEATEVQKYGKTEKKIYKLRDLTAMYKDLTADMAQTDTAGNELLESLMQLERRVSSD